MLAPDASQPVTRPDKRLQLVRRWGALKTERSSWMSEWQDLSRYLLPRSGRFFPTDTNKGGRRDNDLIDNTATRCVRVLAAGMMSSMTSPARPWFALKTGNPDLDEQSAVKDWLAEVTQLILAVFSSSNTYRSLHSTYEELGVYGTAAKIVVPDFQNVIHHHTLTAGEYAIGTDYKGTVNTLCREFQKTVAATVAEFGLDNCSDSVRTRYRNGDLDTWVRIVHIIEPRSDYDAGKRDSKNMPWSSIYFEPGEGGDERYLRESGFKDFPALVSRWGVTSGDIYGSSPGMEARGDVRQLQHQQLRKGQAIDFMTKPPLAVPIELKNSDVEMFPGGLTYVSMANGNNKITPLWDVRLDLGHLQQDLMEVRERIKSAFYADTWLMLSEAAEGKMTATEVAERKEEKLLLLGPTSERLHNEELAPLVEMAFSRLVEAGAIPPAPPEMHGMDLNVNFISIMAQAQRAIGTNSIDRFVANLGQVATFRPDVLDKFNADEWADRYSDMLGIDPNLIVGSQQVALVRKSRADQQAAAQKAQMASAAADTAQKLGNANMADPNGQQTALGAIAQGAGGTLARGAPSPLDITRGTTGYV